MQCSKTLLIVGVLVMSFAVVGFQKTGQSADKPQNSPPALSELATIRVYDGVVLFPAPTWAKDALSTLESSKSHSDQKKNSFVFELIQKDDNFARWKRLYSIRGWQGPNSAKLDLDNYVARVAALYLNTCPKEQPSLKNLGTGENGAKTVLLLCGHTASYSGVAGYGPDVGEVALMSFFQIKDTVIQVQFAWRGPNFEIDVVDVLPKSEAAEWSTLPAELDLMIDRFQKLRVSDPEGFR